MDRDDTPLLTAKQMVEQGAVVTLPLHLEWSGPRRSHDLSDHKQLLHVYETVLREGSGDDVRRYVDLNTLIEIWDEIMLPDHIRVAWTDYFERRRGLHLTPRPARHGVPTGAW